MLARRGVLRVLKAAISPRPHIFLIRACVSALEGGQNFAFLFVRECRARNSCEMTLKGCGKNFRLLTPFFKLEKLT